VVQRILPSMGNSMRRVVEASHRAVTMRTANRGHIGNETRSWHRGRATISRSTFVY
jgi:hypothetical protein